MIKGAPFRSLTMPPMYGKRRPATSGDKSGRRFFVEKMTWKSREAKLCGIDLRPVPGLIRHYDRFPTADAVGYFLSPFGLGGGIRSKSIVAHHGTKLSSYATARARISLGSRISAPP